MSEHSIYPAKTFRLVCFDCDSTLVTIEGIDELARLKGKFEHIAALTRRAMEGELKIEKVFAARLALLQPTRADLRRVAQAYREHLVPDARPVIAALRAAGCAVHIVSGGLLLAVQALARDLGLPTQNVHAVPIVFDQLAGEWWRYEQHRYGGNPAERYLAFAPTPLAESQGKRTLIAQLAGAARDAMLVGDGVTDLEARTAVKRFVGFGGVVSRAAVAANADVFIAAPRLAAIVPLAVSVAQAQQFIGGAHESVWRRGVQDIENGLVKSNWRQ